MFKTATRTAMIVILAGRCVMAQQPSPAVSPLLRHSYLDVKNVSDSGEIQRNWETSWGSYDRDRFHRLILKVRLGTVASAGGDAKLVWMFVGRRLADKQLMLYGMDEKRVSVPKAYFVEGYAAAPDIHNHVLNLAALGERYVSGATHEGWIVCALTLDGSLIETKASSETLERIPYNRSAFEKLLATFKKPTTQRGE